MQESHDAGIPSSSAEMDANTARKLGDPTEAPQSQVTQEERQTQRITYPSLGPSPAYTSYTNMLSSVIPELGIPRASGITYYTLPPPTAPSYVQDDTATGSLDSVARDPAGDSRAEIQPDDSESSQLKRLVMNTRRRRQRALSHISNTLQEAAKTPSMYIAIVLATRLIFTIGALLVFALTCSNVGLIESDDYTVIVTSQGLALTYTGIAILGCGALIVISDAIYIIMLINRDMRAVNSRGMLRIRQKPYAFYWTLFVSIILTCGMLAIAVFANVYASRGNGTSARAIGYIAIAATLHIAADCIALGALFLDWIWTNNAIVFTKTIDDIA